MVTQFYDQRRFDLYSYDFLSNPYPTYQDLLENQPIYQCPKYGFYYIFQHKDIKRLLRHPHTSSDRSAALVANLTPEEQAQISPLRQSFSLMAIFNDPPQHTPIRKLMVRSLSNKVMNNMTTIIETVANQLIDLFIEKKQCDLIKDFAYPLPAVIISKLLGVPVSDIDKIKSWSDDLALFLSDSTKIDIVAKASDTVVAMSDYFSHLLTYYRNQPADNFMTKLIAIQQSQISLTDANLIANAILLVFGGHETTTNLIGNGWMTLKKHPEQLAKLGNHLNSAIEECLRFESPFQRIGRISTDPIDLDGFQIKANHRILLVLGAANRDPAIFQRPNQFDITRSDNPHLAFGHGIHLCSGASLSRLEAKVAFSLLQKRLHNWQLVDTKPKWQFNLSLRGMLSCPLQAI
ncbi:cytochrome P450 [Spartinivicinus ruber]|uniref:cytochrome P450 n=1 Tax=Spartinivicinus ruber TaxID=2683272 RepID=UPI0013D82D8A|nr:cytochrome P450 [Spartinivicinus ruber]